MTAKIRVIVLSLLLGTAASSPLVADPLEDFRLRLENAECVIIALSPRHSHEFPKVLAAFGHLDSAMINRWMEEARYPGFLAVPGQPVLYISAYKKVLLPSGTIFTRALYGKALEISGMEPNELTIPFGGLGDYIKGFHNPRLEESFVAKDWIKFIPEHAHAFSDEELRAMAERQKAELQEEESNRPFFR